MGGLKLKLPWDTFSRYTEAVRDKLPPHMHPFTYLAGGSVVWPLACGDVDAFYVGHPNIFKAWLSGGGFYQLGGPKYIPAIEGVVPFTLPGTDKTLQIIGTSQPMLIDDLLETFDLCNCMYALPITATSSSQVIRGALATDAVCVRVNRSERLHNPLRTLERYFKYVQRANVRPDKWEIDYIINAYLQQEQGEHDSQQMTPVVQADLSAAEAEAVNHFMYKHLWESN